MLKISTVTDIISSRAITFKAYYSQTKGKNKSCPHENGEWKYFPKRLPLTKILFVKGLLYTHSLRFKAGTKKLKEANPT